LTIRPPERLFAGSAGTTLTLAGFIHSRVEQNPAVRYIEIAHTGERVSRTLADLHSRALAILRMLRDHVTAGETDIVLCFASALDFIPAAWACVYGGYSSFTWHVGKSHDRDAEIRSKLEVIERKLDRPVLLTSEASRDKVIPRVNDLFRTVIPIDGTGWNDWRAVPSPEAHASSSQKPVGHAAFLHPTSGTTGVGKLAVVEHRRALARILAVHDIVRLFDPARISLFPFDSLNGALILYPGLADCIYLQPGRLAAQPLDLLMLVEEFRLEGLSMSSSMLARILDAADGASRHYNLTSLKRVRLGSERVVPDVVRRLRVLVRRMGAADLKVGFGYGMTEAGPVCLTGEIDIDRAVQDLGGDHQPVSVGPCIGGMRLRIVDDAGAPLPSGKTGTIEVWSDNLFSGYRKDPEETERSFTPDGWLRTGDVGFVNGGELTITGRLKATIIVNARKYSLESIEAPLRGMEGISRSLAVAAAVRDEGSPTDELVVFFVPRDATMVEELCRRILQEVGERWGIPVKHFVPVGEADIPLTPTGKIRREELVHRYQSGILRRHVPSRSGESSADRPLSEPERWLADLWQRTLGLSFTPSREDSFFALGGDSLASSALIFAVEDRFACELPLEDFFLRPTIATLHDLIQDRSAASQSPRRSADHGYHLLHKLQSYVGSWPGERMFADSLMVGLNRDGRRPPIFWVFQESKEFLQLGKHLGPDQPLYGMRSCVGIVSMKDHSADVIETVCNRYLWEILALPVQDVPFFLGGNCQAGIFALALARRLKQIRRTPSLLILAEWNYSYGRYAEPTLLLYGDRSRTAEIYQQRRPGPPNWQEDFPDRTVAAIPGGHGEFFTDENVGGLVEAIRKKIGAPGAT
jgi:acyl-CoA synthetase (AMP-forming)/AMP-acid ligase II/acyl carrier protein